MATTALKSCRFTTSTISCEDLTKPKGLILTGLGFLDHMIDQINSHGQIGIALTMADFAEVDQNAMDRNRHADHDQGKLMSLVGAKIGTAFKQLMEKSSTCGNTSRFSCPLDEALVTCVIARAPNAGTVRCFTLPPYGTYPSGGRKKIGCMETDSLVFFWESLAEHSDLEISLRKVRGDNAHHIVEASFKAFSRSMRNLLDGIDTVSESARLQEMYGPESKNWKESVALGRHGSVSRKTKETSIAAHVRFDGGDSVSQVDTGLKTLNDFLSTLATSAEMDLECTCQGDLWIDEHHTAEDVAIAIGQALDQAFGTKAGLNRMWCADAEQGDTKIQVVIDLSNRPCLTHNLNLDNGKEKVGDLPLEMFEHVLDSLVVNARMTVHILQIHATSNLEDTVKATAEAFGKTLKYCAMIDHRRSGVTASSKGTLSV